MNREKTRYQMYNSQTRRYEVVDLAVGEFLPGQRVMVTYLAGDRYVTIPGASSYKFNANLELELDEE